MYRAGEKLFLICLAMLGVGSLLSGFGIVVFIYLYGIASVVGPLPEGVAYWHLVLQKMLDPKDALYGTCLATGSLGWGIFFIITSILQLIQAGKAAGKGVRNR